MLGQTQKHLDPAQLAPADPGVAVSIETNYPTTSMPIERAVPRIVFAAASTVVAFMSGIFCAAMARICFSVTLPFFSLFGVPEPFSMPAALSRSTGAGGVLVMKLKLRSA